ncbi:MAG: RagB/SusD family nutrient uptake outer membrane protein [Odoribacteraceae bacterium]|nr:RagB/SusD family nutrient uptake outer membrane protein [Odoribacteraceae bacterium]
MKHTIYIALLLAFPVVSCTGWLDVEPRSQVKDEELFSTEAGFKEALAGVYALLVTDALYVKELRFGMVGVLAHEWDYQNTSYEDETTYNYEGTNPTNRIENIWQGLYNAVANANAILEVIDDKKNVFSGANHAIIKGEALALRAFIHLDLLRCFGASPGTGVDRPAIPYVTRYAPLQSPQLTVGEVIDRVLVDLDSATFYLEADPLYTGEEITELVDNGYLLNRQLHLNYYAARALQARAYLYKGEYTLAAAHAREVILSGRFPWASRQDLIDGVDYTGATEHLWAIDVNNLQTIAETYFQTTGGSNVFSITRTSLLNYHESITDDYRYLYLYTAGTGANSESRYIAKYNVPSGDDAYYTNKMVMIKIAEMHFILAEALHHDGGDYLPSLNATREARGVTPLATVDDFDATLVAEYRKEFIGEGQLFFLYKRRNMENIPNTDVNPVEVKGYIFPLPDSEREAADRNDNR